jgi:spore coat protein U-like protein
MKSISRIVLTLALGAFAAPGLAATATSTFQVTANVAAKCQVVAPGAALAFGAYDPSAAAPVAQLTVQFHCTKGTTWTITLDAGLNAGKGAFGTRAMSSGTNYLGYELYTDNTYAAGKVWATTLPSAAGTYDTGTGTGGTTADSVTVYGQLPAGQYVAPGSYSDTITFVVNY